MFFFFFNDPATTEIYTLSLHDALPISHDDPQRDAARVRLLAVGRARSARLARAHDTARQGRRRRRPVLRRASRRPVPVPQDRKSTRLNSSHANISYAVFCLKKKKK